MSDSRRGTREQRLDQTFAQRLVASPLAPHFPLPDAERTAIERLAAGDSPDVIRRTFKHPISRARLAETQARSVKRIWTWITDIARKREWAYRREEPDQRFLLWPLSTADSSVNDLPIALDLLEKYWPLYTEFKQAFQPVVMPVLKEYFSQPLTSVGLERVGTTDIRMPKPPAMRGIIAGVEFIVADFGLSVTEAVDFLNLPWTYVSIVHRTHHTLAAHDPFYRADRATVLADVNSLRALCREHYTDEQLQVLANLRSTERID